MPLSHVMILSSASDQPLVDAVAVSHAFREDSVCISTALPERIPKRIGRTDPVHIVIPYDTEPLAFLYLFSQKIDRLPGIRKKTGIVEVFQASLQKQPRLIYSHDIPVADQSGKDRRYTAGCRYFAKIRPLGGHCPFLFAQIPTPMQSALLKARGKICVYLCEKRGNGPHPFPQFHFAQIRRRS